MSELLNEEIKFDGPRFNVVRKIYKRDDGTKIIRDIVNPGDATIILPITSENEVVFITQYRESVEKVCLELPAGMVDKNEKPIETAKRELEEETGIIANNIEHLVTMYTSNGYTSEKVHIFVAKDFEKGCTHFDETEEILEVKKIPMDKCIEMAKTGKFENATEIVAILLYYTKYME